MDKLLKKIEALLQTIPKEKRFVPYDELEEKARDVAQDNTGDYSEILDFVCTYCIDTKDNFFLSKLYGGSTQTSLIADMIISYFNTNVHTYACSPLFTVAENLILQKIIGHIGYDEKREAQGLFLPGGSYCTTIAMICARYRKFPASKSQGVQFPIQVITSTNSHYSIDKSMIMMGVGTDNVIKIDFETTSVEQFEQLVVKNNVFLINSTFGTTSQGTLEDISKFSKIIKKYGIWHHIDACQGTTALFSSKYRHLTRHFKEADSVTLDAHKGMGISVQCSALILKQGQLLSDCSKLDASYLFHQDAHNDISNRSFQCGRRADGFKLWFCDKIDDLDEHATLIFDRIKELQVILSRDERYVSVHPSSPTHLCFKIKTFDSKDPVDIHKITSELRKEHIHLEYFSDYFRVVPVNSGFGKSHLEVVLDKIYETYLRL